MTVKERLSHLNRNSWHAWLVRKVYGDGFIDNARSWDIRSKACPYWWLIVPSSPIIGGLKIILFVFLRILAWVFWAISWLITLLFGYVILEKPYNFSREVGRASGSNYDSAIHVKARQWAPWWILVVEVAIAAVVVLVLSGVRDWFGRTWHWWALAGGITAGLTILGTFYAKVMHGPVSRWYEKNCPPIVWEDTSP